MIDEGPTADDVHRFSDGDVYCTECGATMSDLADVCPQCGTYLTDGPSRHHPDEQSIRQRWIVIVVVLVVLAFLIWLL